MAVTLHVAQRLSGWARRVPMPLVYILALLPLPIGFWQALTGQLGPEPIKALEHFYGWYALAFMVAVLSVTPLRRFLGLNLMVWRRALGLTVFAYVTAHLAVWLVLDVQDPVRIWADIVKRPYITIGMVAFLLLIPLALTSRDRVLRRMGPLRWRRLHRLTYVVAVLGALHFIMLRKGVQIEPLLWMAAVLGLLALRLPRLGGLMRPESGKATG